MTANEQLNFEAFTKFLILALAFVSLPDNTLFFLIATEQRIESINRLSLVVLICVCLNVSRVTTPRRSVNSQSTGSTNLSY